MVSIPIPNRWNPHQPEIIVNLFPQTLSEIVRDDDFTIRFQAALKILKPFLAITIEHAWGQQRAEIHDEINWIAAQAVTVKEVLKKAVEPIQRHLRCDSVKIFLLNEAQSHMQQLAPDSEYPTLIAKQQDIIGQVWNDRAGYNTGTNINQSLNGQHLLTPIYRQGRPLREVVGVIWCEGKRNSEITKDFTVTDELTLDAAQAALVPQLERMLAAERRAKTMSRVNHELKGPLTVFRGATKAATKEVSEYGWHFRRDHLGTMQRYLRLMSQVVAKASFLKQDVALKLEPKRTLLFEHVIQPAIDDLDVYLEDRQFRPDVITTPDPDDVTDNQLPDGAMCAMNVRKMPILFVDQIRFQQVVFNILANAIKYAKPASATFKVVIFAATTSGGCNLIFRDNGTGIPKGMEDAIFLEGVRGPDALNSNVAGDGLGLFIVREILAAHGATIRVTHNSDPTEFTIFIPDRLADFNQTIGISYEKNKKNDLKKT
jgi:signal transduction histidine kinase